MTADQAKDILCRYRSEAAAITDGNSDREVAQAIALARQDAELGRWWDAQRAWQNSVRETLRSIEAPERLRTELASIRPPSGWSWLRFFKREQRDRAGRNSRGMPQTRPVPFLSRWGVAAGLAAVLFAGLLFWRGSRTPSQSEFNTWHQRMARISQRDYRMDIVSTNLTDVRQFLTTRNRHDRLPIPRAVGELPVIGGKALRFQNQPVSMICFDRGRGQMLWLFVVDRPVVPDAPIDRRFIAAGDLATACWTEGTQVVLVAVMNDQQFLENLLVR